MDEKQFLSHEVMVKMREADALKKVP